MREMYEVIFEDVPYSNIWPLLSLLTGAYSNTLETTLVGSDESFAFPKSLQEKSRVFDLLQEGHILTIKTRIISGDGFKIADCNVRLFGYDGKYDIDFNFIEEDIVGPLNKPFIRSLAQFAIMAGTKNNVVRIFSGMEPADDQNTRLFTGEKFGPYYFSSKD